jgi:hypothetical protein
MIGDPVLEDHGCVGEWPALDSFQLFHPERHATERQGDIGRGRRRTRRLVVGVAGDVERRSLNGLDAGFEGLERGEFLRSKGVHQTAGVVHPRCGHGG